MIVSEIQSTRSAVVMAADGVRLVAFGSDSDVAEQIAEYVKQRCNDTLWPDDARRVHELLGAGREDEAISIYFEKVGQRWDDELLTIHD